MPVPPCCITLVHGTWARRAAWVKDDSLFCRQLRQVLGPTLQFCAFTWSGANWQSKRLRAAAELSQQLAAGVLLMPVSLLLMPFGPESNSHRAPDGAVGRGVATRLIDARSIQSVKSIGRSVSQRRLCRQASDRCDRTVDQRDHSARSSEMSEAR